MSYTVDLTDRGEQQAWMDEYALELCTLAWNGRQDMGGGRGVVLVAASPSADPKAVWECGTVFLEQVEPPLDYDPETQFMLRFVWQTDGRTIQSDFRVTYPPEFDKSATPDLTD